MTLKQDWERGHNFIELPQSDLAAMLQQAIPHAQLTTATPLSANGCRNSNYKLTLSNDTAYVLRLHTKAGNNGASELSISTLVKNTVPVAEFIYEGSYNDYDFSLCAFIGGITLRELVFSNQQEAANHCFHQAGEILHAIGQYSFDSYGFFDQQLTPQPFLDNDGIYGAFNMLLSHPNNHHNLGKERCNSLKQFVAQHKDSFPAPSANLVHGDFDPANIFVAEQNGTWQVAVILDWEFAFSDTFLWDIANMLRFSHVLPSSYKEHFLTGFTEAGGVLPKHYEKQAKLLDIISLLSLSERYKKEDRPNQFRDILALIDNTMHNWGEFI